YRCIIMSNKIDDSIGEWQNYIDNILMARGGVSRAAIHGIIDGKRWATTPDFGEISLSEIQSCIDGFIEPEKLQTEGIRIAGEAFSFVKMDMTDSYIYCKNPKTGCMICKCKKCIIFSQHDDPNIIGHCSATTLYLADFLKSFGC
ncbi:unnamed protein product, partial [Owenia fusiformis]